MLDSSSGGGPGTTARSFGESTMVTMPRDLLTRHRLTVDHYHRMVESGILGPDDRVELVSGEVLDMSPIGSLHAAIVRALSRWMAASVGDRAIVSVQNPVLLDDASEPQPDIAILLPCVDCYAAAHPGPGDVLLVVEVAETSLAYDLEVKVPLYARHGIAEVWVIDAATRTPWAAMYQKGQGRAMSGALLGVFAVQYENASVVRSCAQHVFARRVIVVGYNRRYERPFPHAGQFGCFVDGFVRNECRNRAKGFGIVHKGLSERLVFAQQHRSKERPALRVCSDEVECIGISIHYFSGLRNGCNPLFYFGYLIATNQGAHAHFFQTRISDAHFIERL
jgi:Uma2 family endonuclease